MTTPDEVIDQLGWLLQRRKYNNYRATISKIEKREAQEATLQQTGNPNQSTIKCHNTASKCE
jgi:hypothetical protein